MMQGLYSYTAAVSITGNPLLSNITALTGLASCTSGAALNSINATVAVQVLLGTGAPCALTSFAGVCAYIGAYSSSGSVSACPAS